MTKDENDDAPGLTLNLKGLEKVRFGRGLLNKLAWVCGTAVAAVGGIALVMKDSPYLQFSLAIMIVLMAMGFVAVALWYAKKYPQAVLLEGAEFLQWKQMDMAARGLELPPSSANTAAPKAITSGPVP